MKSPYLHSHHKFLQQISYQLYMIMNEATLTRARICNHLRSPESIPRSRFHQPMQPGMPARQIGFRKATQAGGTDSLETIPGLLKLLQFRALTSKYQSNYTVQIGATKKLLKGTVSYVIYDNLTTFPYSFQQNFPSFTICLPGPSRDFSVSYHSKISLVFYLFQMKHFCNKNFSPSKLITLFMCKGQSLDSE